MKIKLKRVSLNNPHDSRKQNIVCISNPAQKQEHRSRVLQEICDVQLLISLCMDELLHLI